MHPILGICPVCGEVLTITRLHCRSCDTVIEGRFHTGRLSQLTSKQIEFVETFLLCEGKIKAVEEKLGISYPTVRARLREIVIAMGYEMSGDDQENTATSISEDDRRRILADLDAGRISSEDAIDLLRGAGE